MNRHDNTEGFFIGIRLLFLTGLNSHNTANRKVAHD